MRQLSVQIVAFFTALRPGAEQYLWENEGVESVALPIARITFV